MTQNQKNIAALVGFILLVAALVVLSIYMWDRPAAAPLAGSSATTSTSSIQVSGTGGYTITQLPSVSLPKAPDFGRPISFSSSIESEVRTALNANLARSQAILRANSTDFNALIALGNTYPMGEGEKKAEEI